MLAKIALRIAVQEALRGRTLAGDNVLDSQFAALDLGDDGSLRSDQDKPFISVFTEGGSGAIATGVFSFFEGSAIDLVLEAGVSASMMEFDQATGESVVVQGIPDTDAGFELLLDLMMRQVADALAAPDNEWAVCAAALFDRASTLTRARVGTKSGGTRIAAQEMRLTGDLIADPIDGQVAGTAFGNFLDLLEASERADLLAVRKQLLCALTGEMADWETVRRRLGISQDSLNALGISPATAEASDGGSTDFDLGQIEIAGITPVEVPDDP